LPVAQAISKTEKPNEAITSGSRRPFSSENGAQRIGPVAKPSTYNDVPSVATTEPTPNLSCIALVAVLKIELANAAVIVVNPYNSDKTNMSVHIISQLLFRFVYLEAGLTNIAAVNSFFRSGQF
jgi:hypothetical protein